MAFEWGGRLGVKRARALRGRWLAFGAAGLPLLPSLRSPVGAAGGGRCAAVPSRAVALWRGRRRALLAAFFFREGVLTRPGAAAVEAAAALRGDPPGVGPASRRALGVVGHRAQALHRRRLGVPAAAEVVELAAAGLVRAALAAREGAPLVVADRSEVEFTRRARAVAVEGMHESIVLFVTGAPSVAGRQLGGLGAPREVEGLSSASGAGWLRGLGPGPAEAHPTQGVAGRAVVEGGIVVRREQGRTRAGGAEESK